MHHFADGKNLLPLDYSIKKLNKRVTRVLKLANDWFRVNKFSRNVSATEMIFLKHKNKNINKCLNFRMSEQKIKLNKQFKYLGDILEDDLYWESNLPNLEKTPELYHMTAVKSKTLRF